MTTSLTQRASGSSRQRHGTWRCANQTNLAADPLTLDLSGAARVCGARTRRPGETAGISGLAERADDGAPHEQLVRPTVGRRITEERLSARRRDVFGSDEGKDRGDQRFGSVLLHEVARACDRLEVCVPDQSPEPAAMLDR